MENIETSLSGSILTIKIDTSKTSGPSSTGKSLTVASTGGAQKVEGTDIQLNINAYRPLPKPAKK